MREGRGYWGYAEEDLDRFMKTLASRMMNTLRKPLELLLNLRKTSLVITSLKSMQMH
jgi:hypothetical protein